MGNVIIKVAVPFGKLCPKCLGSGKLKAMQAEIHRINAEMEGCT